MTPEEHHLRRRAKLAMRRRARGVRASVPSSALATRSEHLAARLEALPELADAASVGLFWPIPTHKEVDLRATFERLRAAGKRLAFPRVVAPERPLSFAWVDEASALVDRGRGVCEPAPEAPEVAALDVVVVPGLLFDGHGHRLGYGAGYYDRTLPRLCPPGLAVGVAFDFQLAPEIPALEDDVPVAVVVTDRRVLDLRRARSDGGRE